ncbi:hypothetical protein GQ53DRAFT_827932 [Thozetella sp. PMI_491]|nr:hypothetical protein GQ53DRAFT_827932 [Thozetella sp. PMI_491]
MQIQVWLTVRRPVGAKAAVTREERLNLRILPREEDDATCAVAERRRRAPKTRYAPNLCLDKSNTGAVSVKENDKEHSPGDDEWLLKQRSARFEPTKAVEGPLESLDYLISECIATCEHSKPNAPPGSEPPTILYTYYPFLKSGRLSECDPHDINFLDARGCLHLPTRAILDQIVDQYFLRVHPFLPFLDEGDFWAVYHKQREGPFSLLVFRAMLFAAVNFVSPDCIAAMGFSSIRSARAAFYRKAKLLHDFGTESAPLLTAQAALLLTMWVPPSQFHGKENSMWLTVAIEKAKSAGADCYFASSPMLRLSSKRRNVLKRLWWCCIMRDRIMSLGLRRPIQITHVHFPFNDAPRLCHDDLASEIRRSKVYDVETKRSLIDIIVQVVELCVVLTDALFLVFPLHKTIRFLSQEHSKERETKLGEARRALGRWFDASSAAIRTEKKCQHDSTTVSIMARLSMGHAKLLCISMRQDGKPCITDTMEAFETRNEIQASATSLTDILNVLSQRRLTRWLPITAVAYTALPLALQVLNVHFSSSARETQYPKMMIDMMKIYCSQYDGTDWVAYTVRSAVAMVHPSANRTVRDWGELLAVQPGQYLRLCIAVDLCLSSGRFPDDDEFPMKMEEFVAREFRIDISGALPRSDGIRERREPVEEPKANNSGGDHVSETGSLAIHGADGTSDTPSQPAATDSLQAALSVDMSAINVEDATEYRPSSKNSMSDWTLQEAYCGFVEPSPSLDYSNMIIDWDSFDTRLDYFNPKAEQMNATQE